MAIANETYAEFIERRFGGVLKHGPHEPNGQCCYIEGRAAYLGLKWTDDPSATGDYDFRGLNDAFPDDESRTRNMIRLDASCAGARNWLPEHQVKFAEFVVISLAQRIIADLPGLPDSIREQCRNVTTLDDARAAARAASYAASYARIKTLETAVDIFIDAAEKAKAAA